MAAISNNPIYGYNRVNFAKIQAAYDTHEAIAATDGIRALEMKLAPSLSLFERKEGFGSPSAQRRIKGKKGGKWSSKFHVYPTTAGTPPDVGPILKAAMGVETGSVYTLGTTGYALELAQCSIGSKWDEASGACVEQLDIEVNDKDLPVWSASGSYARHIWAYRGSSSGVASPATVIPVTSGHDGLWSPDAYVDFEGAGNTNRLISAVTPATPSITISSGLTTTIAADSLITPYCPTPTVTGNDLSVGNHALTFGGTTQGFISAKFSFKTGFHLRDKEASADRANGIFSGPKELSFEIMFYAIDALGNVRYAQKAWDQTSYAISLRLGENTTAKRCTLAILASDLDVVPIDLPEKEEATYALKGNAIMSAASMDEFSITFD